MKALITGGAGFIGQHLARRLRDAWELTALDLLNPQVHLDPDAARAAFPGQVVVADVSDPDAWARLNPPDLVLHLAAETGTAQSMYEVDRYRRVNVEGTRLAGKAARDWGVPLVALSSRAVYGEGRYRCPDGRVQFGAPTCADAVPEASQETDEHRPVSVYAETKSAGESLLAECATDIPVAILRPQNVIGPGQALHNPYTGVLAAFLARLREGQPLLVYGDGHQTRDFVHVQDLAALVEWSVARLLDQPPSLLTLNCGTGVRTTLDELARYALQGSPVPQTEVVHVEVHRAGDIEHACADLTLARTLGAPTPAWSTRDAVAHFIAASWAEPGASPHAWEAALDELAQRGLTR